MLHPLSGKYNYWGICRWCGTAQGSAAQPMAVTAMLSIEERDKKMKMRATSSAFVGGNRSGLIFVAWW
jgi:hypothetical protein